MSFSGRPSEERSRRRRAGMLAVALSAGLLLGAFTVDRLAQGWQRELLLAEDLTLAASAVGRTCDDLSILAGRDPGAARAAAEGLYQLTDSLVEDRVATRLESDPALAGYGLFLEAAWQAASWLRFETAAQPLPDAERRVALLAQRACQALDHTMPLVLSSFVDGRPLARFAVAWRPAVAALHPLTIPPETDGIQRR